MCIIHVPRRWSRSSAQMYGLARNLHRIFFVLTRILIVLLYCSLASINLCKYVTYLDEFTLYYKCIYCSKHEPIDDQNWPVRLCWQNRLGRVVRPTRPCFTNWLGWVARSARSVLTEWRSMLSLSCKQSLDAISPSHQINMRGQ